MSEFEETRWREPDYAKEYRDNADHYVQERETLHRILLSFYRQFVGVGGRKRFMDLGCGDGLMTELLYGLDPQIESVLIDGAPDMIGAAEERLVKCRNMQFIRMTFEEFTNGQREWEPFDFIATSFALHHLKLVRKLVVYKKIHELLKPGAWFVNLDVVLPTHDLFNDWYYELWREWIVDRQQRLGLKQSFEHVPAETRAKPENRLDTLQVQLQTLEAIGFRQVECHYKYGLYVMFAGMKANSRSGMGT